MSKVIKSSFAKTVDCEKDNRVKNVVLGNQFNDDKVSPTNDHIADSKLKLAEEKLQIAIEEAEKMKQEAQVEYE
ncbi:hypothetical protein KHA80_19740 [Anaerobacillus sp. HL2]|nr:hypothetical protein KHA80_19740 [Anaerobacillus sp. HL2]